MDDKIVVVDTETFGLDARQDPIIEVGAAIYSVPDLLLQAEWSSLVWMDTYKHRVDKEQKADSFVFQMHVNSGLWEDAEKGAWTDITPFAVEQKFVDKLNEWGVSKDDPMVGSSIQFDREMLREQMPEVEKCFSYRNIDTSSIKELCRRFNPELYSRIDEHTRNAKAHRVLSDIEDTVSELKFYVDNFLFCWEE